MKNTIQKKHNIFCCASSNELLLYVFYLSLNTSTLPLNSTLRIGPLPMKR